MIGNSVPAASAVATRRTRRSVLSVSNIRPRYGSPTPPGSRSPRRGLSGFTPLVRERSQLVLARPVSEGFEADAAFVNASHVFHSVFVDLYFLQELVRVAGLVILDDCQWPSVSTAVRYFQLDVGWPPVPVPGSTQHIPPADRPVELTASSIPGSASITSGSGIWILSSCAGLWRVAQPGGADRSGVGTNRSRLSAVVARGPAGSPPLSAAVRGSATASAPGPPRRPPAGRAARGG